MIDLILYGHPNRETEKRFHNLITAETARANMEITNAFESLKEKLKRPSDNRKMVLIFVDSEQELSQMLSLQDCLSHIPSILILNDHDPKITALAHLLRPRFVGYTDWDTSVLLSIVIGMIRYWGRKELTDTS